jgi:hypothetical protein
VTDDERMIDDEVRAMGFVKDETGAWHRASPNGDETTRQGEGTGRSDEDEGTDRSDEKQSTADRLVELALATYRFGVTDTGETFAVRNDGPKIARMMRGGRTSLRAELAAMYRREHKKTPNASALVDALTVLEGEAQDAAPEKVYVRVARHGGNVIIDMGDAAGRAVEVRPGGWRILAEGPVLFRRSEFTCPYPEPVAGCDVAELNDLLALDVDHFDLLVATDVAALLEDIPHPIATWLGEHGTGKSTRAEINQGIIDPSSAPLRSPPSTAENWAVAAMGSWCITVDNLSTIPDWFSDLLCRTCTGEAFPKRKLYSDDQNVVLRFMRCVQLTSIDPGDLKGDLADRLIAYEMNVIDEYVAEDVLKRRAAEAAGRLFGAFLDLLAKVLAVLPTTKVQNPPRLAAYSHVLAAVDKLRDTDALGTYREQRSSLARRVLDSDVVAVKVEAFMEDRNEWKGTARDLLERLTPEEPKRPPRGWPKTPQGMGQALTKIAPGLRKIGITVERPPREAGTGRRTWTFTKAPRQEKSLDKPVQTSHRQSRDDCDVHDDLSGTPSADHAERHDGRIDGRLVAHPGLTRSRR